MFLFLTNGEIYTYYSNKFILSGDVLVLEFRFVGGTV